MIPEEYGGSGLNLMAAAAILEEIHCQSCNAAACHAQMYTLGTKIWTSRAEYSDLMLLLAHTSPRGEVQKKTDGLSVFLLTCANSWAGA